MSKRFGRNQKRKLKQDINKLTAKLIWTERSLDRSLNKPNIMEHKFVYIEPDKNEHLLCVGADPVQYKVDKERLYHLNLNLELRPSYEQDIKMFHIKYTLSDCTVGYAISETALYNTDKDELKHYITAQMADILVNKLRGE